MNRFSLTLLICIAFVGVASAHDPGLSTLMVKVADNRLEVSATFSRKDIEGLLALQRGAALEQTNLAQLALETVRIEQNGQTMIPTAHQISFPGEDNVEVRLTFDSGATEKLTFRSSLLERFAPGHRQLLSVIDAKGRVLAERLLSASVSAADLEIQPAAPSAPETSTRGFVLLGVEHILKGYDHLLFLFALLIVARNFMASLKVITCFTAAHSLTLALATLDVVQLPSSIVEPLIAASIVYVSIENLARRGESRGRLALTFAFGLIHGLGFATVLRELGLSSSGSGIAVPLLSFNFGVELGQVLVAAVLLPLIWKVRQHPIAASRLAPACSLLITAAGTYWLIERLLIT
jgi:hydrogenase/urease accessory protein HupE